MEGKESWTVADAFDYEGLPADMSKTGGWLPAVSILVIELCERLSTMGVAVNLVTYLGGTMHLPSAESANVVSNFLGTSFLLCLLGGVVADSFLGRYFTIAIFSLMQMLGTTVLAVATKLPQLRPPPCAAGSQCQRANGLQMGVLYLGLYSMAVGTGGLKSSVSGFCTDQFNDKDEKEKRQLAFFFNRFFFFITLGTLLAVTVLVYIQDEVGRSWAYGICAVAMFFSLLLFLSGTRKYRYKNRVGSPLVHILHVVVAAARKRKLQHPSDVQSLHEVLPEASRIRHTNRFRWLDKAAIMAEEDTKDVNGESTTRPNPWRLCSVTRIEEVKMVIMLLPIWATTIMFWTVYAQVVTFSVQQASTMRRNITRSFLIPAGSLTAFFVVGVLLTLVFDDRVTMPLMSKWRVNAGHAGFSNLEKIGIGLLLSIASMVAAALTEKKRLAFARATDAVDRDATLPITVFALVPQFYLVGAGTAFAYTGQLDFFLTRSPKGMKTMSTGLFLSTIALGLYVSSFLVFIVKRVTGGEGRRHGWLADNINHGRLDHFYELVAVLSAVNLVAFLLCAKRCKTKQQEQEEVVQMEPAGAFKF